MSDWWLPLQPLVVLIAAGVLEKLLPEPAMALWSGWLRLADRLALKVNNRKATAGQRKMAGLLAAVLMLLPWPLVAASLPHLLQPTVVVNTLLLYLALMWTPLRRDARRIADALDHNEKDAARFLLRRWVLRDTRSLSAVGLSKATVETVLLQLVRARLTPVFWYLIGGAPLALLARALWELRRRWSEKIPAFRDFGLTVARISRFAETPAVWPTVALLRLRPPQPITIDEPHQPIGYHTSLILRHGAASLRTDLGGPVMYGDTKRRRPRYICGADPSPSSIRHALRLVRTHQALWLSLIAIGDIIEMAFLR